MALELIYNAATLKLFSGNKRNDNVKSFKYDIHPRLHHIDDITKKVWEEFENIKGELDTLSEADDLQSVITAGGTYTGSDSINIDTTGSIVTEADTSNLMYGGFSDAVGRGLVTLDPVKSVFRYTYLSQIQQIQFSSSSGMVVTDDRTSKGLVYGGDYEGAFTNRSLVTKAYVDAQIAANDTLQEILDNGSSASISTTFSVIAGSSATSRISLDTTGFLLEYAQPGPIYTFISANPALGHILIQDQIWNKGMVYDADYSGNYTTRSLVDKGYVDGQIAAIPASNLQNVLDAGSTYSGSDAISMITTSTFVNRGDTSYTAFGGSSAGTGRGSLYLTPTDARLKLETGIGVYSEVNLTSASMLITDLVNTKGLEYAADYKANFTANSLVNKSYVDTQISSVPTVTVGSNDRIPYSNSGGTDFDYSANFKYDGTRLYLSKDNSILIGRSTGSSSTANYNVFIGDYAGSSVTNADWSIGIGYRALNAMTTGGSNIALGYQAMEGSSGSITGGGNIAMGYLSGQNITTAAGNILLGPQSGNTLTTGGYNVMIGSVAGRDAVNPIDNVFIGANAGLKEGGQGNVYVGESAGHTDFVTSTDYNVAIGQQSLGTITTGASRNTTIGRNSLGVLSTGANNIALGFNAGDNLTTGSNNIIIGYNIDASAVGVSNEFRLGDNTNVLISGDTSTLAFTIHGELTLENGAGTAGQFLKSTDTAGTSAWASLTEADISDLGTYALVNTYNSGYVPRWNATTNTLESGSIQDDGTTVGISVAPDAARELNIASTLGTTIYSTNTGNNSTNTGIRSEVTTGASNANAYGVYSDVDTTAGGNGYGGFFQAKGSASAAIGSYGKVGGGNVTGLSYGAYNLVLIDGALTTGSTMYGSLNVVTVSTTGTHGSTMIGSGVDLNYNKAGGTLGSAFGFYSTGIVANDSGATIGTAYGLYLGDNTGAGTITNSYGVYQAGANDQNYFGGNVGIGTLPDATKQINVSTTLATGLEINSTSDNTTNYGSSVLITSGISTSDAYGYYAEVDGGTNGSSIGGFFKALGAGTSKAAYGSISRVQGGDIGGASYGSYGQVVLDGAYTSSGSIYGSIGTVTISTSGIHGTSVYGVTSDINYQKSGGTLANAYGFYHTGILSDTGATITNAYGVYVGDNQGAGTITNSYGIYQVGTDDLNYFAGNVGIGTTSIDANVKLQVEGSSGTKLKIEDTNTTASLEIHSDTTTDNAKWAIAVEPTSTKEFQIYDLNHGAGAGDERLSIDSNGGVEVSVNLGVGMDPVAGSVLSLATTTNNLEFIESVYNTGLTTAASTLDGYIKVEIGGNVMYINAYSDIPT